MKWILVPLFIISLFLIQSFPEVAGSKAIAASKMSISPSAQYIRARNAVRAFFGGIRGVTKVTYILTYEGNGLSQGVEGSFFPGKKTSFSRDIYLGTCSGKVCRPHTNIKNIQLKVITKFINGKSSSKIYKVKQ